jgi:hypothetical protein
MLVRRAAFENSEDLTLHSFRDDVDLELAARVLLDLVRDLLYVASAFQCSSIRSEHQVVDVLQNLLTSPPSTRSLKCGLCDLI